MTVTRGWFHGYRGNFYGPFNSKRESDECFISRMNADNSQWGATLQRMGAKAQSYFGIATVENKMLLRFEYLNEGKTE